MSYRSYWTRHILKVLKGHPGPVSVKEISDITKFTTDDITNTLKHLGMIQFHKGQHAISALPEVVEKCAAHSLLYLIT